MTADAGYYGQPIVRPHVWKDYIAGYFFSGGFAGASSLVAAAAQLGGRRALARHARRAAVAGVLPSPVLLIADLGRPGRFTNMLRVLKPSSPMSVGSWLLAIYAPTAAGAAVLSDLRRAPRLGAAATLLAGVTGPAISTYTSVLLADTATPAWREASGELPFVFAASSLASAGAAITALSAASGDRHDAPTRLAIGGAIAELVAATVMKLRLGPLAGPFHSDAATRRYDRAATVLSTAGAVLLVAASRNRLLRIAASAAIMCGSLAERLSVLHAGTASANDPQYVLDSPRRITR